MTKEAMRNSLRHLPPHKLLQPPPILPGHMIRPRRIRPTHTIAKIPQLPIPEQIDRTLQIPRLDLMTLGHKTLERNDLTPFLEVEEVHDQFVVEGGREGLVVDEDDVGAFEYGECGDVG